MDRAQNYKSELDSIKLEKRHLENELRLAREEKDEYRVE